MDLVATGEAFLLLDSSFQRKLESIDGLV